MQPVQLHLEIQTSFQSFLIDRLAVDVTELVVTKQSYAGIFGLAEVEMSFQTQCAENFYGPDCDVFCTQNCAADHCVGVDCGQNSVCVSDILTSSCVCESGFTGPNCTTEFDVCSGVECNFGSCVVVGDRGNNYACVCQNGYTGQFCEMQLDSYRLQVTLHSFSNPEGMCANNYCGPQFCCEGSACPNSCEYYFSLCLRPAGTPVSIARKQHKGDCETTLTVPSRLTQGSANFTHSVFGTPNPIVLSGMQWVSIIIKVQTTKHWMVV